MLSPIAVLKTLYHKTILGKGLQVIYHNAKNQLVPPSILLRFRHKKRFGRFPKLNPPETLNEKILWLKLNEKRKVQRICADKYAVREYIANKIGEEYLIPLYFVTENPDEIKSTNIPVYPCIIKTNHDSGGGYIVRNPEQADWANIRKNLKARMKKNYYTRTKEWQYKHIERKIIVEKLLMDDKGHTPMDYKLHCFNGKVRMIQVDMNRGTKNHYRNWYNSQWELEPYRWSAPKVNDHPEDREATLVPPPKKFEKMKELSEILAADFDLVRIDWYEVQGRLFFGEITFHHEGGNQPIQPFEWDLRLGRELQLKQGDT